MVLLDYILMELTGLRFKGIFMSDNRSNATGLVQSRYDYINTGVSLSIPANRTNSFYNAVTSSITLTLPDAGSVLGGFHVSIKNSSTGFITIASASGLIDGVNSFTIGPMDAVQIVGDGVGVYEIFSFCEVDQNKPYGEFSFTSSALTTISAVNTPTKALGTTTPGRLTKFTMPQNNRLQFNGEFAREVYVTASISIDASQNTTLASAYLAVNGIVDQFSHAQLYMQNGANVQNAFLQGSFDMVAGDYVEAWIENNDNASNLTVTFGNMIARV